jgi:hypothetical protein
MENIVESMDNSLYNMKIVFLLSHFQNIVNGFECKGDLHHFSLS